MQQELSGEGAGIEIRILGVNAAGHEAGNPLIVAGRTLPWLQDTPDQQVWQSWEVAYRDVIVLDPENHVAGVLNLTDHDLAVSAEYEGLKSLLTSTTSP